MSDNAQAQIDLAKLHAVNHTKNMTLAMYLQGRFQEALAVTLRAGELFWASTVRFRGSVEGSPTLPKA